MLTLTHELISLASGSTFLEVSKSDFEDIYFKSPSPEEQAAIVQVLQASDKEIQLLKNKTEKLTE